MSVLVAKWRFLAISARFASLVRKNTGWIRKLPFCPLNTGAATIAILDFRLLIANSAQLLVMPGDIGAMARQHPF
jgi:hypothetical protein